MSKRTEELFKLHREIEELQEKEAALKNEILQKEIIEKGKESLQDRFVVVRYNKGTEMSVSIDAKMLQVSDPDLFGVLSNQYPKVTKGKDPYYSWSFAKDK